MIWWGWRALAIMELLFLDHERQRQMKPKSVELTEYNAIGREGSQIEIYKKDDESITST
jgi:hypothetical protein